MSEMENIGSLDTIYDIERSEWSVLNISLRQHGLPSVDVLHPKQVQQLSDVVLLSTETAKSVRQSLSRLMKDGDRRQELVREMIITNNQLREELKAQSQVTAKHDEEINRLRVLLQNLPDHMLQVTAVSDDIGRLNLSTASAAAADDDDITTVAQLRAKCEQLRQKCDIYEQEVNRLSGKLERFVHEEEERRRRETEIFHRLRKKPGRERIDETVLSIIDSYERHLSELRCRELGLAIADDTHQSQTSVTDAEFTPNIKTVIRMYEKSLRELKSKLKIVENEHELLKLELQSRPQVKDIREAQLKVKQLERVIRTLKSKQSESFDISRDTGRRTLSTEIDFLTAAKCRLFLKSFCVKLVVSDLSEVVPALQSLTLTAEAYPHLEQFVKDVLHVVDCQDALKPQELRTTQGDRAAHQDHQVWCEKTWSHVLPTLEYWALELRQLKELQLSIKRMIDKVFPWQCGLMRSVSEDHVTTSQLIETIDALIYDDVTDGGDKQMQVRGMDGQSETESRAMLQGIVRHFQTLFDVPNVLGVYARMSAVYCSLSEMHNVLTTLKDHLDLDESVKSSAVVDAVAQLYESRERFIQQLTDILHVDEPHRIIPKIEEYQEFFTAFHGVMHQLMLLLGVERIDHVLPAVQSLTRQQ